MTYTELIGSTTSLDLEQMSQQERVEFVNILLRLQATELANDFRGFVAAAFRVLEPEALFMPNWHVDAICDHLSAISRGEIRDLVVTVPPRHMKSLLLSVLWPAWEWTQRPQLSYICASYGAHLALRDAAKMRRLVESSWYQQQWGGLVKLLGDATSKERFENTRGGFRASGGVGGFQTGEGGDRIIVDDAHKTQEFESDAALSEVRDWWDSTMVTRVRDPRTVARIVIGQRVHERDLPGYLLSEKDGWVHLDLPAEYEPQRPVYPRAAPSPLPSRDPRREEGELLWPARFGPEELAPMKLRSYFYASQFQQRPAPAGGGLLRRDWFRFYTEDPSVLLASLASPTVIQSWDMAFKDAATSAYVCGQVWATDENRVRFFLLDQVRGRFDFPKTCTQVLALSARWPQARRKLVEDKANGPAVIAHLKSVVNGLVAVEPRGTKEARAAAVSPFLESGAVQLPHPSRAPWVEELIGECEAFPNSAYTDQVDTLTQALDNLAIKRGGAFDFEKYCQLWDEESAARRAGKLPESFATPSTSDPKWAGAEQRGSMLVAPIQKSPSHLPDTLEELIARTSR